MSLDYAVEHLTAAANAVAGGDISSQQRLQRAWTDHVQMLWERPCLPGVLNDRFRALWTSYTAPGDDPRRTALRSLSTNEAKELTEALIQLTIDAAIAHGRGDDPTPSRT